MKILALASVSLIALMSDAVETVLIKGGDGEPVRVNKSDFEENNAKDDKDETKQDWTLHTTKKDNEDNKAFDPNSHTMAQLPPNVTIPAAPSAVQAANPETPPVAPSVPSPNSLLVMKEGKKFFIVVGPPPLVKVVGVGLIDEKGYDKEEDAIAAINGLPDAERIAAQGQSKAVNPA